MATPHLRVFAEGNATAASAARAILLSSYASGATEGNRLGTAGYSYDFVARLFAPLLQRLGTLIELKKSRAELSGAIENARRENLDPIHVVFRPFQDADLVSSAPNVVVPAWEFPDIPNDGFDGNPQNNWVETANRCALVLVGGPFTANAMEAAGVTTPIRIVPVPTPEAYFHVSPWQNDASETLDCSPLVFPEVNAAIGSDIAVNAPTPTIRGRLSETIRVTCRHAYRNLIRPCVPQRIEPVVSAVLRAGISAWREQHLPFRRGSGLNLSGVVYTSIFNPDDGRKNWQDMITAFLHALRDCEDATLVLKLITSSRQSIHRVLSFYQQLDIPHRCRVVIIPDFLSEADMMRLARASTYYLTTTRAEGNCLPLMNYLAAGRPGVSPSHTAIGDYFNSDVGFVVESHPEPCAWPQDSRLRCRTTWHRLVWPSLVEQIRRSYEIAKNDRAGYESLATAAKDRMLKWSHPESVWPHLRSALDLLSSPARPALRVVGTDAFATEPIASKDLAARSGHTRGRISAINRSASSSGVRRMKVVVSLLNFRPGKIGGTETYLRQLISRLPKVSPQDQVVLLMDRDLAAANVFPGMERAVVDLSARQVLWVRGLEAIGAYRARGVEETIERLQPDVVFFPQQSIFPKNVAAPCVLVVHDLYHLFLPEFLSPGQRLFRQRSYAYSMSRADRIIAISQFTKKTILQQYNMAAERITVVPHGWERTNAHAGEADPEFGSGYLYYPAITRPHKNHHVLFESIAALRTHGLFDNKLILSGIQTAHWKTLRKQIRQLDLEQTVQHVGYVSYERVRQLYAGAGCVVFPSSFEGFGLPVVEACEAGKKILVSQLEVFDEIGVPAQCQIDFADPEQLYRGLHQAGATVLRNRPWAWDESAAATIGVLSDAAGCQTPVHALSRAA